ncbi:hypothetical protein [Thalassoglobus polymorphus]|uniref:TIGR03009 domain-containing protein n=1 Tax=Thalassoglobus polymorphus TaxID=2527994 RepID=A0A517QVE8_9PLAN|nr:hypothetical protein [Thalassoglobus polymorphus]QDT35602.1 hypothetical protein Mal48_48800 [Thalassoglobus polymorphus]
MPFSLKSICQAPLCLAFGIAVTSNLAFGQFPQTQPNTQQPAGANPLIQNAARTPVQMEIKPERPSPQMLLVLQEWEQKTAGIDTLQGVFRRYVYDSTFGVEKRAVGEYWFGSPDKARMDFNPDPDIVKALAASPGQPLTHKAPDGKVYSVQADAHKVWICNGKDILEVDVAPKQYSKMEIPPQYQGQRITDGPMPFLFGMKADSVTKRYKMAFGEMHDPERQIHIIAYPLVPNLRREFQRAEVLLDPNTFLPNAVKLWDPSGNQETVYRFYTPKPFTLADKLRGPWSISLRGYEKMQDIKANPDQLPMMDRRTSKPTLRQTVGGESPQRTN